MRKNFRRLAVFIILTVVAATCLLAYLATAAGNSSPENPLPLTVSKTSLENGQMLVSIAKDDFPRKSFKKTAGNLQTEIRYSRSTAEKTETRKPTWRLAIMEHEMLFSLSPAPSNEIMTIEISLSEFLAVPPFDGIVRTNWYRWSKQF